ncbi:hypothetical protein BGZ94_000479 [Podila epigama]|nr:hypothetical protein BGZ94_000479 [Podila epigama]
MAHLNPPQDDLLARNAIRQLGVNASIDWIRQCIAFHSTQSSLTSTSHSLSLKDLANFVYQMYLLADFRTLEPTPIVPSTVSTPHRQILFTSSNHPKKLEGKSNSYHSKLRDDDNDDNSDGVILQILEIVDISTSALKLLEHCEALGVAGDQPGGFLVGSTLPRDVYSLDLTDGVRKIRGVTVAPIPGIAMEMKLGAKVRVKNVEVRHGILQLYPSNTIFLGGEVATISVTSTATGATTTWMNPRPAVNAQDIVPSNTVTPAASIGTTGNTLQSKNKSKSSSSDTIDENQFNPRSTDSSNYFDRTDRMNQQQQDAMPPWELSDLDPNWDYHPDMDTDFNMDMDMGMDFNMDIPTKSMVDRMDDDFDLPEEDVPDWEVLSQLSVGDTSPQKPKSDITRTTIPGQETSIKFREPSPPLVATLSPAKRALSKIFTDLGVTPRTRMADWSVSPSPSSSQTKSKKNLNVEYRATSSSSILATEAGTAAGMTGNSKRNRTDLSDGLNDDVHDNNEMQEHWRVKRERPNSPYGGNDVTQTHTYIKQEPNDPRETRLLNSQQARLDDAHMYSDDDDFVTGKSYSIIGSTLTNMFKKYTPGNTMDKEDTGKSDQAHQQRRSRSGSIGLVKQERDMSGEQEEPQSESRTGLVRVKPEPRELDWSSSSSTSRMYPSNGYNDNNDSQLRTIKKEPSVTALESRVDTGNTFLMATGTSDMSASASESSMATSRTVSTTTTATTTKIASKTEKEPPNGTSYHAAIDILSDSEDENTNDSTANSYNNGDSRTRTMSTTPYRRGESPLRRVKTEPGVVAVVGDMRDGSEGLPKTNLEMTTKKEEIMLEFDMDDEADFGGLMEFTQMKIPEVLLENVKTSVENGHEVIAKARVGKLGKFSLTTLAVSIPVFLLPVQSPPSSSPPGDTLASPPTTFMFESVLDQSVIEILFEYTVAEFRNLVRVDEHGAMRAVKKLRSTLTDVETIECRFKGQRAGIPVIRELKILSKKPPKPL